MCVFVFKAEDRRQDTGAKLLFSTFEIFLFKESDEKVTQIAEVEADVNISRGLERGFQESLLIG